MGESDILFLRQKCETIAKEYGFLVHPEEDILILILQGLLENKKKYGEYYCPCQFIYEQKKEELNKIICPCEGFKESVSLDGSCHCGLFVTGEMVEQYHKDLG